MQSFPFNHGWRTRSKVNPFLEAVGGSRSWEEVTLPHDALVGLDRSPEHPSGACSGFAPGGVFEYVKTFAVRAEELADRVELRFDGVYRHAVVYINGAFAGQRPQGYTPFRVRIDPFLREGSNEIRVECRTHLDSRWYTGAGIYRHVTLLRSGPVHIAGRGVRVTTPDVDEDLATVDVTVPVQNDTTRPAPARLVVEVVAPDGDVVARADVPVTAAPGTETMVRQRLTVSRPERWSVEHPSLYRCRTVLSTEDRELDAVTTTFGVRRLQWDAVHGLRINGGAITLRGGCVHHDNGILGAATFARAEERRVEILKAAGFNAIRSAHNPISSAMLDACDRLGMLVMDESFDSWTIPKSDHDYSLDLPTWWRQDLTAMVERAVNHPSVIMYSIGNEIPETGDPWGAKLGREMVDLVKSIDPTRPVTNGINPFLAFTSMVRTLKDAAPGPEQEMGINTFMTQVAEAGPSLITTGLVTERIEESMALLDVAGYNYAEARYELDLARHPQRLIVGTESNLANLEQVWDLVLAHPRVLGDFTWTAWDYLGEAGIGRLSGGDEDQGFLGSFPWRLAWAGDIDSTGRRRAQSFYRETVWGLRQSPYIAVHRPDVSGTPATGWSWGDCLDTWSWPGHEGEEVRVDVYSAADEVELLLDDVSLGTKHVGEERRFLASFTTDYRPGRLVAVARRDGVEVGREELRSAGEEVVLAATADRAAVTTDDGDLVFIEISVQDGAGIVHTLRDRRVSVSVRGSGRLQALGSADPKSTERYTATTTETFAGRALAVVRATGEGTIEVMVEGDGCPSTSVHVRATAL